MRARPRSGRPAWHRAWTVAAVTLGALVAAAAFRSSTGVLMEPIEQEFGWDRRTTSGAVSLNLVLFGLVAPFAAALMDRWGVRRTVTLALGLVGVASAATTLMTQAWQLWVLWGLVIGTATGMMALVFGAIVANRWFVRHRGLVMGIFSAGNATGQLVFLPIIAAAAAGSGWRTAALTVAGLALAVMVAVALLLHEHPHDLDLKPLGADDDYVVPVSPHAEQPVRAAIRVLRDSSRTWTFWALMATFFVCGWSTNGLIQTHFVPAAHDHGMPTTTAAGLLALVGIFDIIGTVASGWLTDRMDPRILLGVYYSFRGLSLFTLHSLLAPEVQPQLWVFIVFYGLDWVATVPPTVALCRQHFGLHDSGIVFGWTFASHMVGAGIGASFAGWIRSSNGSYEIAWYAAGALCLLAAFVAMTIRKEAAVEPERVPVPT